MRNYQAHVLQQKFKQASNLVYDLSRRMSLNGVKPWDIYKGPFDSMENYSTRLMPYFNSSKFGRDCPYSKYKTLLGKSNPGCNALDDTWFNIKDNQNGMSVLMEYTGGLSIDINGVKNPPNRFGYDIFTWWTFEGASNFFPTKTNSPTPCSFKVDSYFNGLGCTLKATTDPNYFKNLPK